MPACRTVTAKLISYENRCIKSNAQWNHTLHNFKLHHISLLTGTWKTIDQKSQLFVELCIHEHWNIKVKKENHWINELKV